MADKNESVLSLKQVLHKATNEELQDLLKFLNTQPNSRVRKSQTEVTDFNREARIRLIEKDIREFGGNTLIGIFRSTPVKYDEIVCDVAKKFSIKTDGLAVPELEAKIFCKILEKALEKMSEEDRSKFFKDLDIKIPSGMERKEIIALLLGILLGGGIASYRLWLIILTAVWIHLVGPGIVWGGGVILGRTTSLILGPVAGVLSLIWLSFDLAGPAYRVTIPCVLFVALLRNKPESI